MRTNRKTEEKKMSMSKNIARLAVTAGLTAALSFGGVMAPVTMAFAAEGGQGSITINKVVDKNAGNKFKAYQIFKAKVVDKEGEGKVASDVKWANNAIASKVITAIKGSTQYKALVKKDAAKGLKEGASASDVAEWLSQNVNGVASTASSGEGTRVAPGDVLYEIAAAVSGMKQGVEAETAAGDLEADKSWTRPDPNEDGLYGDGYYLFVSDGLTNQAKPNTGTSPIFALVGGDPVTVTEKTSIPTVNKEVREGTTWGKMSDSYIGEEVEYKQTGSVASNIDTFTKYEYSFHDHLSVGLEAIKDSVNVEIDGKPTNACTVDLAGTKDASGNLTGGQDLTISFSDLKAAATAAGVTLTGDSKVVVTYKAKLTDKAEYKGTGNTNEVELVYSNNPMTGDKGTSEFDKVSDYVFGLDVTKTDPDNESVNLVAGFKVKMIQEGTKKTVSKWLKQDGSFTDDEKQAYTFETTGEGNKVFIPGLVAGTYLISESKTPAGYNTIADFEITVTPTYNATGMLTELKAEPSSGMVTGADVKNPTTTQIPITIQNKKGSGLPLTGLNGVTFTWIAGGAVLCIGVAHLIRSRKQAEESDQE